MKNFNQKFLALMLGLCFTWVHGLSLNAQEAPGDGPEITISYLDESATDDLSCAKPTYTFPSGTGCMDAGQTSETVQIRVQGEDLATFKLWNHATLTDGALIEEKTAVNRRGVIENYVIFSLTLTGPTTVWASQHTGSCDSQRQAIFIPVYPKPAAPTISNQTICEGNSFTMSPTGSVNYTWYTDASKTSIDHYGSSYTLTIPDGITTKSWWVSATNAGNCEGSGLTQVTITVDQKAEPQTLQQTEKSCPNGTDYEITMLSSQSNYVYKLYKVGTSGALETWTAPSTNGVSKAFDITSTGTYYVEASNQGQCTGTTTEVGRIDVTSYDAPDAISAINDISVCVGETISISPSGGGAHQTNYRWFTSSGGDGVHFSDRGSYSATPGVGVTEYWIAAITDDDCTGPREYVKVTVNSKPGTPGIAAEIDYCDGNRPTMTPTGASSYRWYTTATSGTAVASGTSYQPPLSDLNANEVIYHVAAVNGQGCESTSRTQVKLIKGFEPSNFNFVQDEIPCDQAGPFVLRVTNPQSAADVTYTLYESDNPGTTLPQAPYDGNGIHWVVNNATSYTVKAVAINGCGLREKSRTAIYSQRPAAPSADNGTSITACKGSPFTLSVDNGGAAQLTYTWYTNSNLSAASLVGSTATLNITVPTSGSATYYVVSRNTNNCQSPTQTIVVTGETVEAPVGLSNDDFCEGTRPTMTPTPRTGETYHWYTAETGGTLLHSGASWTPALNELANTNVYWVEAESALGCFSTRTRVELTKEFAPREFNLIQDDVPCDETGPYILRVTNPESAADVTYTLYESDNPTVPYFAEQPDGNGGIHWIVNQRTSFTVKAEAINGCGIEEVSMTPTFTPRPAIPAADDGTSITACKGSAITLSVDGGGIHQLTYSWYTNSNLSAGSLVGSAATLNITVPTSGSATYYVVSRNTNNCQSPTQTIVVTGETVEAPVGLSNDDFCEGTRPTMTPTPRTGETYHWYTAETGGTLLHSGASWTPALNELANTNVYWVEAESALGCYSTRTRVELTKEFEPREFNLIQDDVPCDETGPYILRVTNPESAADVTYTLYESDNPTVPYFAEQPDGNGGIHWIVNQRTSFTVKAEAINGCGIEEVSMTPDFTPRPAIPAADDGTSITACKGSAITLSVDGGGIHQLTYFWYDNSSLTTGTEVSTTAMLNVTVPATGSKTYYVFSRNSNGCQSPTQEITVSGEVVSAPGGLADDSICGSDLPNMVPTGGSYYRWYLVAEGGSHIAEGESYQPSSLALGDNTFHVATVSALGCESTDRTEVTFTRIALPDPFTVLQAAPSCENNGPYFFKVENPEDGVVYTMHSDQDLGVTYPQDYRNAAEIVWEVPLNQVYRVIAYRTGACESTTISEVISPVVSAPPSTPTLVTSANQSGCDGETATLTVSNPVSENVTDYYWYYDSGLIQAVPNTNNEASITVDVGTTTTHYYVVAKSDIECRSVTPQHFTVVGNSLPLPLLSIDQVNVCSDAGLATIPLPDITGNGTWKVYGEAEGGLSIASGSDDLTVPVIAQSTIYHVERVSEEGCSATERTPVTVYRYPTIQTFTLQHQGLGYYCESTTLRLDGSENGVTYRLYRNGGVAQTQTGDGNEIIWENITLSGDYTVKASWPGCTEVDMANELRIDVDQVTPFNVTGGGTVCEGEGLDVTVDGSQTDFTYFLKIDGEVDMTTEEPGDGNAITWSNLTVAGSYQVVALSPGCGYVEMNNTVQLNITEKPDPPFVEDIIIYEWGVNRAFRAYSEHPDATFNWYDADMNPLYTSNRSPWGDIQEEIVVYVETVVNGCVSELARAEVIYTLAQPPLEPVLVIACGEYFLQANGAPPANVSWYWQGMEPNGTDKLHDASKYDYRVLKDGTYYIRAYDEVNRMWGPVVTASAPVSRTAPDRITPVDCDDINATYVAPTPAPLTAGANYNYVGTYFVTKAGMSEEQIIAETDNNNVTLSASYIDGLGRDIQTVNRGATPEGKDMVVPNAYDAFGRESKIYMPYASVDATGALKIDAFGDQAKFFGGDAASSIEAFYPDETVFYEHTILENSPLARPMLKMGAGDAWAGSGVGVRTEYDVNHVAEGIRIWKLDASGVPVSGPEDVYPTGSLTVTITTDEEGVITREYKDKSDQIILVKKQLDADAGIGHQGWQNTYSIFDDYGNLSYTVPPVAVSRLEDAGWVWTPGLINEMVYHITHDQRGRKISKRVPGANTENYVYDKLDRLVASQNGAQSGPVNPHWIFTKYDAMNRPVVIGAYYSDESREDLQSLLDGGTFSLSIASEIPESPDVQEGTAMKIGRHESGISTYKASESITLLPGFDTGGDEVEAEINADLSINNKEGYNDGTFPSDGDNLELYEVIFYDDYRFTQKQFDTSHPEFTMTELSDENQMIHHPRSVKTGTRTRILETDQWLNNVYFYDEYGRIIQSRLDNQHGGEKIETKQFDRAHRVLNSYTRSTNPEAGEDNVIAKSFTYDHFNRILALDHKINNAENFKTIGTYSYDEMGKLKTKVLGDALETLEFSYNIRGWMTGINEDQLAHDQIMTDHFFAMQLSYEHGFTNRDRSGNITGIKWQSKTRPNVFAFGYGHDQDDRLKVADFSQDATWNNADADYSVGNINYDLNGNLLTLTRQGMKNGAKIQQDDLFYTYLTNSPNRLLKVEDLPIMSESEPGVVVTEASSEGFYNPNDDEDDYIYDRSGNLISDANKGIASIRYNYMNLPDYVVMATEPGITKTVTFLYDARGKKLSEITNDNGEVTKIDYTDGYTYQDNELKLTSHDEGRIRKTPTGFVYDYYIKDHLGNSRITLTEGHDEFIYLATMETDDHPVEGVNLAEYEEKLFLNLDASRKEHAGANYTVDLDIDTNEVSWLNGSVADRVVGPGKMINVYPGDLVEMEVFAYYEGSLDGATSGIDPGVLASAVSTAFGGLPTGTLEQQYIHSGFSTNALAIAVGNANTDDGLPRAYLNYVLFNEDFEFEDAGFAQVTEDAQGQHQALMLDKVIVKPGYLYVYVSNETNANFEVYFDDLRIKHKKGVMVAESHYYPFGSSIKDLSYSDGTLSGIPEADKMGLGWNDLGFRRFDPILGRFFSVDPKAELTIALSTYQYAANNPIDNTDILGLTPIPGYQALVEFLTNPEYGNIIFGMPVQGVEVNPEKDWRREIGRALFLLTIPTPEAEKWLDDLEAGRVDPVPPLYRRDYWELKRELGEKEWNPNGDPIPTLFRKKSQELLPADRFRQNNDPKLKMYEAYLSNAEKNERSDSEQKTAQERNIDSKADREDSNGMNWKDGSDQLLTDLRRPPTGVVTPPGNEIRTPELDGAETLDELLDRLAGVSGIAFMDGFISGLLGDLQSIIDMIKFLEATSLNSFATCNAFSAATDTWACQEIYKLRLELAQLTYFLNQYYNDEVFRRWLWEQIGAKFDEYIAGLDDLTYEGQKQRGELAYNVFSSIIPATKITQALKAMKMGTWLNKGLKFIPSEYTKYFRRFDETGVEGPKIRSKGDQGDFELIDGDGKVVAEGKVTGDGPDDYEVKLVDQDKLDLVDSNLRDKFNKNMSEDGRFAKAVAEDKDGSFTHTWNQLQKTELDEASKNDPDVVELAKDMLNCGG